MATLGGLRLVIFPGLFQGTFQAGFLSCRWFIEMEELKSKAKKKMSPLLTSRYWREKLKQT